MQPFPIGTVVRFKPDERSQSYGMGVYGQVTGLIVAQKFRSPHNKSHVELLRIDGSDPTKRGFVNCVNVKMLVVDTFMHAARQAVASAEETPDE